MKKTRRKLLPVNKPVLRNIHDAVQAGKADYRLKVQCSINLHEAFGIGDGTGSLDPIDDWFQDDTFEPDVPHLATDITYKVVGVHKGDNDVVFEVDFDTEEICTQLFGGEDDEQNRRDEKRGLHPQHEDVAN